MNVPCSACAAKAEELARLRVQFCACEAHMAELLDAERAEVAALRSRIAVLEAEKRASDQALAAAVLGVLPARKR